MIDLSRLSAIPIARREEQRFRDLLDEHHYLGAGPKIGETIWYAADDGSGAWPALAAFSAAALKCTARDRWIGWSPRDRFGRLHLVANNVRLLLRGRQPNLGSRFLGLCARRINADWQARYHHPLLLLETFCDPERHSGTVYRAANWITVGRTRGYRRHGNGYVAGSTPKQVLVLPLAPDVRARLTAPALAPELQLHGTEKMRKMNTAEMASLYEYFTEIDDPRGRRGRRYHLPTLLSLCAAATLCGATGWKAIHAWIQDLGPGMLRHFRLPRDGNGTHDLPSIYCIRNIMVTVDPDQLAVATASFCRDHGWDQGAGIAIDGKTIRGAVDDEGRKTHVLGASSHDASAPLAQKKPC